MVSSPKDKRHVALLALAALHGAVQRHAGVAEGKVVQAAVHVVRVAFIALQAEACLCLCVNTFLHVDYLGGFFCF